MAAIASARGIGGVFSRARLCAASCLEAQQTKSDTNRRRRFRLQTRAIT
jgi:hypothetical protein